MKEIIPHKLIATLNPDGTVASALLQYKLRVDGAGEERYYTMTIDDGIDKKILNNILADAKTHTEKGEKIK